MTNPAAPVSFRSDEIDRAALDELVAVLDLQAALPGIERLRAWSHEALRVRAGEHALDIGSGTGSEVQVFAAAVGESGCAVGVDPNPGMLTIATERAQASGSAAAFVAGDAYSLPFPDAVFDCVRCERVFQHLTEPARAAAEITRVLRPGGRAMLVDSDWGTAILHPGDPEVLAAIATVMLARTANPHSGRLLPGQLATAGLVVDDVGSQALIQDADAASGPLVAMMTALSVASGAITEAEAQGLSADLEAGARRGDFHLSVTMFAYLAHKA